MMLDTIKYMYILVFIKELDQFIAWSLKSGNKTDRPSWAERHIVS